MRKFKSGIVVAAHPLAAKAGVRILRRHGNAIDAAVATALALGSVAPAFSGIGGGGFALIWLAREGKSVFVDYRERAPHAAKEDMFQVDSSGKVARDENSQGYKAVAVPGALAGHSFMLERYGTLTLKETMASAIGYARRGTQVAKALASALEQSASKLRRFKTSSSVFLKKGKPYRERDRISLKDLAKSLDILSKRGASEFYTGNIAKRICYDMTSNGGLLSNEDFDRFRPTERKPIRGTYKGLEVISAPPPSSGGIMLLQVLNMLEHYGLMRYEQNSPEALHLISEALIRSSHDARSLICDPDFSKVPVDSLIAKRDRVDLTLHQPSFDDISSQSSSSTSHFVVIDGKHNVVSMTETIECYFGSGIVVPGTGIILNDTMHDFDPRTGRVNSVAPWKIPMSSMCPTILLRDQKPFMAVGAAGATRIISSTLETILNVVEFGMTLQEAVAAPRIHTQKDIVQVESGIPISSVAALRVLGHKIEAGRRDISWRSGLYFGGVHSALVKPDGTLEGGPDPRRDGAALGPS